MDEDGIIITCVWKIGTQTISQTINLQIHTDDGSNDVRKPDGENPEILTRLTNFQYGEHSNSHPSIAKTTQPAHPLRINQTNQDFQAHREFQTIMTEVTEDRRVNNLEAMLNTEKWPKGKET